MVLLIGLVLALWLRAMGIQWGLPDSSHYFSFHPDETVILLYTLTLDLVNGQIDPQFYNYGTVYLYLVHLAILVVTGYGWLSFPQDVSQYQAFAGLYLAGRWISVGAGVLTCWLVWEIGRRIGGYACAAVSTLLMAVAPLHVLHSHFLTTDATATLFTSGVLLAALLFYQTGGRRALLAAGALTGLAAATRYNAALVAIAPMLALWMRARRQREGWIGRLAVFGAVSAVVFMVACPGMWVNPEKFWHDLSYEARHVREGHGLVFVDTGLGWVYHYWTNLRFGLGLPLLALSTLAIAWGAWRRSPEVWILWVFAVGYYLFLGSFAVRFARYLLPILPPLVVITGWLVVEGWRTLRGVLRGGLGLLAGVAWGDAMVWSIALVVAMQQPDVRLRALEWIRREVPTGTTIGFATIPWFYTPPLSPYWGELEAKQRAMRAQQVEEYRLVIPEQEWDLRVLEEAKVVVLSQFEVDDAVRVGHSAAKAFLERLQEDFERVALFDVYFEVAGWRLGKPSVPHDMLYPYPRIEVWRKR